MNRRMLGPTLCLLLIAGCRQMMGVRGSGVEKTETRQVGDFDEIEFRGVGTMNVVVGGTEPLTITTDDNLLPMIKSYVHEGRLIIAPTDNINPKITPVITLGARWLIRVKASGAVTLNVGGVKGDFFDVDVNGAARVAVNGKVKSSVITLSGAGELNAVDLVAEDVEATLSGVGGADVHAIKSLKAAISGLGVIRYKGDPVVEQEISGAGSIKKME